MEDDKSNDDMKSYDRFGIELSSIGSSSVEEEPLSLEGPELLSEENTNSYQPHLSTMGDSTNSSSQYTQQKNLENGPSEYSKRDEDEISPRHMSLRRATNFLEYNPKEHELEEELGFIDPSNPPIPGWNRRYLQWKTRRIVEHFTVRILTAIFIIIDMILLIIDLTNNTQTADDPLEICALVFSIYFVVEVTLRIFGLGWMHYFIKWYNVLDFIIVMVTFIMSVVMVVMEDVESNPGNLLVILRLIRLLRITRLLWQRRHLQVGARQFISQNKRRYQTDGFDLDLTYVSPRIIAMSFPSTGARSLYRNDLKEVARFFNKQHKNRFRIYNLCSERDYDRRPFNGNVKRYLIDDHNVPSMKEMLDFSEDVRLWMAEDEENVIAVHCKGGKGRTGTMICVVLIDIGLFSDSSGCLGYFGDRRTDKNAGSKFQGVETPSQSRYVEYYECVVKNDRVLPDEVPLIVTAFTIKGIRHVGSGDGSDFHVTIQSRFHVLPYEASLHSSKNCKVTQNKEKDEIYIELYNSPVVKGDTKVMFHSHSRSIPRGYEKCPFYFWFHTGFIKENRLELERHELDNPHKSKTWKTFRENFAVVTHFAPDKLSYSGVI